MTKYRRKVIDNQISEYAKGIFERIAESYHITLIFSREKTPEWLKERNNKEKVNNAEEDPQLEKDREAFLAQLKKIGENDYKEARF